MSAYEVLKDLGGLLLVAAGGLIWLIRLEGRVNSCQDNNNVLEKKTDKIENKHDALDNRIVDKLSIIEKSLAKIEGRLSIEVTTKRGDL